MHTIICINSVLTVIDAASTSASELQAVLVNTTAGADTAWLTPLLLLLLRCCCCVLYRREERIAGAAAGGYSRDAAAAGGYGGAAKRSTDVLSEGFVKPKKFKT